MAATSVTLDIWTETVEGATATLDLANYRNDINTFVFPIAFDQILTLNFTSKMGLMKLNGTDHFQGVDMMELQY